MSNAAFMTLMLTQQMSASLHKTECNFYKIENRKLKEENNKLKNALDCKLKILLEKI